MNEKQIEETETILGRDVTVTFEDPEVPKETVAVRKVALRHLGRYANVISNDDATEIALYTGKSVAWAESLDDASVEEIIETGRELSRKRFTNFAIRATKFDQQIRQDAPVLGQLADLARNTLVASRSGGASNT